MNLMLTETLAKEILRVSRTDDKLLRALAQEWIRRVTPELLYPYLLSDGVAASLLAERLRRSPEQTLADLSRLADGRRPPRAAAKPKRGRKPAKKVRTTKTPGKGQRQRLTPEEIGRLKEKVVRFLGANGWSTRKQISVAAAIPTPSLYNRVVTELREAGQLVAKGEKAKRVYSLAGKRAAKKKASVSKRVTKKKAPKKKVAKKAPAKRKVAKKKVAKKA